jgi:hypothetical protein
MNTPAPPPPPAASPTSKVLGRSAPSAGALIGAIVGHLVNVKLGIPDPYSGAIVAGLAGLGTAVLHYIAVGLGLEVG